MNIFDTLPAGDSASWTDAAVTLPDGRVATSASWTLTYYLRGPAALDLVATADSSSPGNWKTALSAAASTALGAGLYRWSAAVAAGSERLTVGSGQLTLTDNLATVVAGADARSAAQKALADCEAAMATFNKTGGKVRKYDIAGRSMEFQSLTELMQLHAFWKGKVLAEQTAAQIAAGLGNPRNLYARFVRPN
ncbi:MAG: hypothetical protein SHS37scaffold296_45 [Burkholderiales phage 68_11]|jgi:hypothetical protein|nr:MAG: hypothetical protein SHS37scaffold296_45 [Burkholderiales phage 68_11]